MSRISITLSIQFGRRDEENLYFLQGKNNYKLIFTLYFLYPHDIILLILNEGVIIMKHAIIVTVKSIKTNTSGRVTI